MSKKRKPHIVKRAVRKAIPKVAKAVDLKPEEVVKVAASHPLPPIQLEWHDPEVPRDTIDDILQESARRHSPESEGESWTAIIIALVVLAAVVAVVWYALTDDTVPASGPVASASASASATATMQPTATFTPQPPVGPQSQESAGVWGKAPTASPKPTAETGAYGDDN